MSRLPSLARPARLTSSLLVRKGEARPAGAPTREAPSPSAFPPHGPVTRPADLAQALQAANGSKGPEGPPLAGRTVATEPGGGPRPGRTGGGGSEERFATTIRLDAVRHYRLKLFAARRRTEVPDLITKALDAYLDANGGDCPCVRGETSPCSC